ncbi:MAG: TIGR03546 family protein [Spirochaetota bacterium]
MLDILNIFKHLMDLLKKDQNPTEVGLAIAFGFVMAFQPVSLLSVVIFVIFFVIKVNKAAGFLSLFLFKIIAVAVEPAVVPLGAFVLMDIPFLVPLWAKLRNIPIVPQTKFYNTAVMGGFLVGIIGFLPMFLGGKKAYIFYRDKVRDKIPFLRPKKKTGSVVSVTAGGAR